LLRNFCYCGICTLLLPDVPAIDGALISLSGGQFVVVPDS
jgi:hypothetical protein